MRGLLFFSLCLKKLRAAAGGRVLLLVCAALLTACFLCVGATLAQPAAAAVRIAVTDEDGTAASRELCAALAQLGGLDPVQTDAEGAARLLADGGCEGILTLRAGFGDTLAAAQPGQAPQGLALDYAAAPGAQSTAAVRETVAGAVHRLWAFERAAAEAGADTPAGREALRQRIAELEDAGGPLLTVSSGGGEAVPQWLFEGGYVRFSGFAALAMLLAALSLSHFLEDGDARAVNVRLRCRPHGAALALATDAGAVGLPTLAVAALYFACGGTFGVRPAAAFLCYALLCTALCLALGRFGAAGRADLLAPFLVLLTGLLGGCFYDVGSLSPALRLLSLCTPEGLLIEAAAGALWPLPVLLAGSAALFAAARPRM